MKRPEKKLIKPRNPVAVAAKLRTYIDQEIRPCRWLI